MMHFHVGRLHEAASLIERFHYSRRTPTNIQCVGTWHNDGGLFGDAGDAVAACLFSVPATRWSEDLLELCRLVRDEDTKVPLTGLIASTVRHIAKSRGNDLLVSFADSTQGHHGGIYQAASWFYAGQRDASCDGILLDGIFIPGRVCNHQFGTRSPEKLRLRFPDRSVEPHYDLGKHLYWRAISKSGERKAQRLCLGKLQYPKPGEVKTTCPRKP
jgi:hypothetical protein